MGRDLVLIHTAITHHGLPVTVMGIPATGLIAVTGYNTPRQHVLGIITAHQHETRTVYRVLGHHDELDDLEAAAAALAAQLGPRD
jgi:hypothetical protein